MEASIFSGRNQNGRSMLYAVGRTGRYHAVRGVSLHNFNLYEKVSSVRIFSSEHANANLILFDAKKFLNIKYFDFTGNFLQITNKRYEPASLEQNLNDKRFDNKTTSILLVSTMKETWDFREDFLGLIKEKWIASVDKALRGTDASRDGGPQVSTHLFPSGFSYLDPNLCYITVTQWLDFDVSGWWDYSGYFRYHVYLSIEDYKVKAQVVRSTTSVEGGILQGCILDKVRPKVSSNRAVFERELNEGFAAQEVDFSDVYLLPGRQADAGNRTGTLKGKTADGATVCFELP